MLQNSSVQQQELDFDKRLLPKQFTGSIISNNIIDIRSENTDNFLRSSLEASIHDVCHGDGAFPDLLLWDEKGLRYFEDVTYCNEYYLTNEEIGILRKRSQEIAEHIEPGSMIIELGSGNLRKIKILLEALDEMGREVDYFALDVSLTELQRTLGMIPPGAFRSVRCFGLHGTYDDGRVWMQRPEIRDVPKVILSLGSTLGSFKRNEAAGFLSTLIPNEISSSSRSSLPAPTPTPLFLIGLDGCKDSERVHAAYNDKLRINRRFVKHGLERANEVLGREAFDINDWDVRGVWDETNGVHNQYYFPRKDVNLEGFHFPSQKNILAVQSHKYDDNDRNVLWKEAGLAEVDRWTSCGRYSLNLLRVNDSTPS